MFEYYVYAYLRKTDGTPYYIGKGKNKRAFKKHTFVSVPNDPSNIVFYQTGLKEEDALYLERAYIALFKRKCDGGVLLNLTEGGEGFTRNHTEETKQKMRKPKSAEGRANIKKARQGRTYGPCSEERKRKIGLANSKPKGPQSAELIAKRSAAIRIWWANRKQQIHSIQQ